MVCLCYLHIHLPERMRVQRLSSLIGCLLLCYLDSVILNKELVPKINTYYANFFFIKSKGLELSGRACA